MSDLLESFGWNMVLEQASRAYRERGLVPARVAEANRDSWSLIVAEGEDAAERQAQLSGRFLHGIEKASERPVTGDWVMASTEAAGGGAAKRYTIQALLPRINAFSRKAKGDVAYDKVEEQVLVANIDTAIIVTAAGKDWNPRRIERYVALVRSSGAAPVLAITKADLEEDVEGLVERTRRVAPGMPVFAVSALEGRGLEKFSEYLLPGATAVLIGSSGAGKSTLLNWLAGRTLRRVHEVRADDHRGRHTTSDRSLFRLPSGALLIDTPGLRELQLWTTEDEVDGTFPEIEECAGRCRFRDCGHSGEPGCAVSEAVEAGLIAPERLEAWRKLRRELDFLERRKNPAAEAAERERWRTINRQRRTMMQERESMR
ncbi:ribosome small subunit-dependent GTPase A [bacterium]|nr:ribosome small subunit-dependent GTPase A [bacterium]